MRHDFDIEGLDISLSNLDKEIKSSGEVTGFDHLEVFGTQLTVVSDTINIAGVQAIIDGHQGDTLEQQIFRGYVDHEANGLDYIKELTTYVILEVLNGNIIEDDIYVIEDLLDKVVQKLSIGHWKSAKRKLDKITPEYPFSDALYNKIKINIDNYVLNNY